MFDGADRNLNGFSYIGESVSESVIVSARLRGLIHRYIYHEVGICLNFHSWDKTVDFKTGDLVFVFQKAIGAGPNRFEGRSGWKANTGACLRPPATNDMKLPVPVLSRPIMQNPEVAVEVSDVQLSRKFWSVVWLYRLDKIPTLL